MNNENLLKGKATQFKSGEEAARNGQKGGLQLGMNNKKRKAFKEYIESELDKETEINGVTITVKEAATVRLVSMLLDENIKLNEFLKAFELIREQIGEKPSDKYVVDTIDDETRAEVTRMLEEVFAD